MSEGIRESKSIIIWNGVVPMRRVANGRGQFSVCQWDAFQLDASQWDASQIDAYIISSGVARGGHGPPQTFGKCFFSAMNWCCYVEVARKCKKIVPELREFEWPAPVVTGKMSATTPPPPLNLEGHGKLLLSATSPPPQWIWCAHGDPGKCLILPPPHWIWSAIRSPVVVLIRQYFGMLRSAGPPSSS